MEIYCKNKCSDLSPMQVVSCWDDAQGTNYAYVLHACPYCGIICKDDVWKNKGRIWIDVYNRVVKEIV